MFKDLVIKGFLVILPQSALEQLSNFNIEYPMIFKITNDRTGASSHCGVLEFSAKEGVSYVPGWVKKVIVKQVFILF